MKLAAIDIGSNSIKLAVVDAAASDSFAVIARDKEVVRLGQETLQNGQLSAAAIERATQCLKRFRSIAEARGAEKIVATATASVREAKNAALFIREVEKQTGIRVEVLSGVEEARLIGLAAAQACALRGATSINLDVGGGSTEISLFRDGEALALFSVRLGAVACTERFLGSDPPKPKELANLKQEIRAAFERPARELRGKKWQQATGTSGTILALGTGLRLQALAEADLDEQGAQPAGSDIVLSDLAQLNTELAEMSVAERRRVPGVSAQRAEIIIAGGLIVEGVMRALRINRMRTCDWALREGVIIDRLQEFEAESRPPTLDFTDQRLLGVHAVGRRFGYEEAHAQQVAKLAESIFDCLAPSEEMTRHQRTLLAAAALLHDVGYHIAHESHHKHSLYLIRHSELTGFSEAERDVIANIARYHRGPLPKERHPEFAELNPADRDTVLKLSAILRIADGLDRSHESPVRELRCTADAELVSIQINAVADCQSELLEAERRCDLFEDVFQRKVELNVRHVKPKKE